MARDGRMDCKKNELGRKSRIIPPIELEAENRIHQEARATSAVRRPFYDNVSNRGKYILFTNQGGLVELLLKAEMHILNKYGENCLKLFFKGSYA